MYKFIFGRYKFFERIFHNHLFINRLKFFRYKCFFASIQFIAILFGQKTVLTGPKKPHSIGLLPCFRHDDR